MKRESDTFTDTRSSLIPMAERAHRDTLHATPNGTAPPDASSEMLASPIPTAQRVQRDTWVAKPNGTASYARSRDV